MKPVFSKTTEKFALQATVSPDNVKLFLDIEAIEKEVPTRDEILAVLAEIIAAEKVNLGVLDDIVAHLAKGEKVKERRIYKGREATPGTDGKVLHLVKLFTGDTEVKIDQKGFAHYSDLHLFDNVLKGQIVARLYPPKKGEDGEDVFGKVIPSQIGKPAKLSLDRSLTLQEPKTPEESYQTIVAETDGYLMEENGKLIVKEEFVVAGNLDYHVGNLDFVGQVTIKGDVMPGMRVAARKGITVSGSATKATLMSTEGDIEVKGHMHGGEGSRVVTGKNFTVSVAQEINAEVVGNITVVKEAMDCSLRAQGLITSPKGKLIGGVAFVVGGAEAAVLGNEADKSTIMYLCSDVEMSTEYAKLVAGIESHDNAIKMLNLHLGPLAINTARIKLLKSPHREKMEKCLVKLKEVETSKAKLIDKKKEMLGKRNLSPTIQVNVNSMLHRGVALKSGEDSWAPSEPLAGPKSIVYHSEEHRFDVTELTPINISKPEDKKDKEIPKEKSKEKKDE